MKFTPNGTLIVTRSQELYQDATCSHCSHELWAHRDVPPFLCMKPGNVHGICGCEQVLEQQTRLRAAPPTEDQ